MANGNIPIIGRQPKLTAELGPTGGIKLHVDPNWPPLALFSVAALIERAGNNLLDLQELQEIATLDQVAQEKESKPS